MTRWWRSLSFKFQAFIMLTVAICTASAIFEFIVEPVLEKKSISVMGGIDWREAPFWLFVAFMIGLAVTAVFTRSVIQRLNRLARATEEIVRGNLAFRIPPRGNAGDVFDKLSGRFNFMAETIDGLIRNERRLLSDISHELRSPLARASAAIDVLLLKNSDNGNTAYLKKAASELAHVNSLIGGLLGQSRNRLVALEGRESIDISAIAIEIVDSFQMLGATQRKELLIDIASGVRIDGHPAQVRLIIENLLANALYYAPIDSRVELHLCHSNDTARLIVRDYGPGVPEELINSIFHPFFRVDASRARQSGGVGLGLTLVREACQALGGNVEAKNSHPGLEMTVLLPSSPTETPT